MTYRITAQPTHDALAREVDESGVPLDYVMVFGPEGDTWIARHDLLRATTSFIGWSHPALNNAGRSPLAQIGREHWTANVEGFTQQHRQLRDRIPQAPSNTACRFTLHPTSLGHGVAYDWIIAKLVMPITLEQQPTCWNLHPRIYETVAAEYPTLPLARLALHSLRFLFEGFDEAPATMPDKMDSNEALGRYGRYRIEQAA